MTDRGEALGAMLVFLLVVGVSGFAGASVEQNISVRNTELIKRGLMIHCPVSGKEKFIGECEDD